jgi:hypothetical protein
MAKAKRLEDRDPHAEVLDYLSGFADWSGRSSPMHGLTTRIDLVEGLLHWRDVEGVKEVELESTIDELIAAELIVGALHQRSIPWSMGRCRHGPGWLSFREEIRR